MDNPAEAVVSAGLRKDPTEFLKSIIHKPVVVKLNSGVDYRGAARGGWDVWPTCSANPAALAAIAGARARWLDGPLLPLPVARPRSVLASCADAAPWHAMQASSRASMAT